jgi:hypothetical protein
MPEALSSAKFVFLGGRDAQMAQNQGVIESYIFSERSSDLWQKGWSEPLTPQAFFTPPSCPFCMCYNLSVSFCEEGAFLWRMVIWNFDDGGAHILSLSGRCSW